MKKNIFTKAICSCLSALLIITAIPLEAMVKNVRADGEEAVKAVWDPSDENIDFDTDEVGSLGYESDNKTLKTKTINIDVTFPGGDTGKKVVVSLAPGVRLVDDGTAELIKNKASTYYQSVSGPSNQTLIVGSNYYSNGDYTYSFGDGLVRATFTITVQADEKYYVDPADPIITDAVKISIVTDQGTEKSASIDINRAQLNLIRAGLGTTSGNVVCDSKVLAAASGAPTTLHTYHGRSVTLYYKYAEITYVLPAGVTAIDEPTVSSGNSASTYARAGYKISSITPNDDGTTTVVYRKENFSDSCIGCQPVVSLSSSVYSTGNKVDLVCTKIEALPYGKVDTPIVNTNVGKITYTVITDDELITVSNPNNINSSIDSADNLEADYLLGRYGFINNGTKPSAPKVITMTFVPKNADNTNYNLPCGIDFVMLTGQKNESVGTVKYYVYDKEQDCILDEERTFTAGKFNSNGIYNISAADLGLGPNEYLASLSYELDYQNSDGTRYGLKVKKDGCTDVANYQTIGGKIFDIDVMKSAYYRTMTITIVDKYDSDTPHSVTGGTGVKVIIGRTNNENFITTNSVVPANTKIVADAGGNPLVLSVNIGSRQTSNTTNPFFADFDITPTIYIRDVYATSVDDKTINSISIVNRYGIDIMQVYKDLIEVTYFLDNTGHVVAKIDTSKIAAQTNYSDKYAAAIGFFDRNYPYEHQLKVTWQYTIPATCTDTKIYNLADVIFVSAEGTSSGTNSASSLTEYKDPYGINTDSKALVKALTSHLSVTFQSVAREDIAISTFGRREDAPSDIGYEAWDGDPSNYILIEPGAKFIIKNEVYNNSGRPTSTDENNLNYIYIPVPQMGDNWGELNGGVDALGNPTDDFTYTMTLYSPVDNPDSAHLAFSYAKVDLAGLGITSTTNVGTLGGVLQNATGIEWVDDSSFDWTKNYNVIRVAISGLPATSASQVPELCLNVMPAADATIGSVNLFQALYYESITTAGGKNFQGWATSSQLALQVTKGTISGYVWKDANGDGIMQDDEPKLEGVKVTLTNDDNSAIETTSPTQVVTAADGSFSFGLLPSDKYTVTFEQGSGADAIMFNEYMGSPVNATPNDSIDSDATPFDDANGDLAGAVISDIDIPYYPNGNSAEFVHENQSFGLVPSVTVHYVLVGNTNPSDATVPADEVIVSGSAYTAQPQLQSFDGYKFIGWCTNTGCSKSFVDGTSVSPASGLTTYFLYGKWVHISYKVEFDSNKPATATTTMTGQMSTQTFVYDEETYGLWENSYVLPGYEFTGWNTASDGSGTSYNDKDTISKLTDEDGKVITLYAQWKPVTYTIYYEDNYVGGTQSTSSDVIFENSATLAAAFTRDGYQFTGWNTEADGTGDAYAAGEVVTNISPDGEDVTLYAQWKANEYQIAFVAPDPTSGTMSNMTVKYDESVTLTANSYKRTGYSFQGWSKTAGGSVDYTDELEVKNLSSENGATVTLYAVWKIDSFTITFDANGGEGTMTSITADYGTDAKLPKNSFSKTGYVFDGWNEAGVSFVDEATLASVTRDYDLTAAWTPITYTVTFDANNGTGNMSDIDASYDVDVILQVNEFTRDGYTFAGWSLSDNPTATDILSEGDVVKNLTTTDGDEVIVYAVWLPITYTIVFDANEGEGQMDSMDMIYDAPDVLTDSAFVRDGYFFLGWALDAAATAADYEDGDTVINLTNVDGDTVRLYAIWKAGAYVTVTAGDNGSASASKTYLKTGEDSLVTITPDEGYRVASVTINGTELDRALLVVDGDSFTYLLEQVAGNVDVDITFAKKPSFEDCSIELADGKTTEFYVGDEIKITAFGAWESDATLLEGDVKYVPTDWHHSDPAGNWNGTDDANYNYSSTFTQKIAGTYTIHVNFDKYIYKSGVWTKDSTEELTKEYIVRDIEPTVTPTPSDVPVPNPQPTPTTVPVPTTVTATPTDASSSVSTGEEAPMTDAIALVFILFALGFVVASKTKKKWQNR